MNTQIGASQINYSHKRITRKAGLDESEIESISGYSIRVGSVRIYEIWGKPANYYVARKMIEDGYSNEICKTL